MAPFMLRCTFLLLLFLAGCKPLNTTKNTPHHTPPYLSQTWSHLHPTLTPCSLERHTLEVLTSKEDFASQTALMRCLSMHQDWKTLHSIAEKLHPEHQKIIANLRPTTSTPSEHTSSATPYLALALKAYQLGDYYNSLRYLDQSLTLAKPTPPLQKALIELIWLHVQYAPPHQWPKNATFDSWRALRTIVQSPNANSLSTLANWVLSNPEHPAQTLLQKPIPKTTTMSTNIALLLPQDTPNLLKNAIQNGVLDAYFSNQPQKPPHQTLHFVQESNLTTSFSRILKLKPDTVIGPVTQKAIQSAFARPPLIPSIALNYVPEIPPSNTLLQWTLSSMFELQAIMEHLTTTGHHTPLLIYEDTAYYKEMVDHLCTLAAEQTLHFEIHPLPSASNNKTLAATLGKTLGLDASKQRYLSLSHNFSLPLQFTPRVRQDIDSIILLGSASHTHRTIRLIRYLSPTPHPIWTLSHIHKPHKYSHDTTMEQVHFFDAPTALPKHKLHAPPRSESKRLESFAKDAFGIAPMRPIWQVLPTALFYGESGALYLDHGTAQRILTKGIYRKGYARKDPAHDTLSIKLRLLIRDSILYDLDALKRPL